MWVWLYGNRLPVVTGSSHISRRLREAGRKDGGKDCFLRCSLMLLASHYISTSTPFKCFVVPWLCSNRLNAWCSHWNKDAQKYCTMSLNLGSSVLAPVERIRVHMASVSAAADGADHTFRCEPCRRTAEQGEHRKLASRHYLCYR